MSRDESVLSFFDPDGWRYHLPAFMIFVVRNLRTSNSNLIDGTIYSLNSGLNQGLCALSHDQARAVAQFLQYMAAADGWCDGARATEALQTYWWRFLPGDSRTEGDAMGTWGAGRFDSEAVGDWWSGGVGTAADVQPVADAIGVVIATESEDLDAGTAGIGLAAAEVIAALAGRPAGDLPESVTDWVAGKPPPGAELLEQARIAVERVLAGSELAALWGDALNLADGVAWRHGADDLLKRLGG